MVHEAYLRLVNAGCTFHGRLHFLNAAALAMRRILANHAEVAGGKQRGGDFAEVSLDNAEDAAMSAVLISLTGWARRSAGEAG